MNDLISSTFHKEIKDDVVYLVGNYRAALPDPDDLRKLINQFQRIEADTNNYWNKK